MLLYSKFKVAVSCHLSRILRILHVRLNAIRVETKHPMTLIRIRQERGLWSLFLLCLGLFLTRCYQHVVFYYQMRSFNYRLLFIFCFPAFYDLRQEVSLDNLTENYHLLVANFPTDSTEPIVVFAARRNNSC